MSKCVRNESEIWYLAPDRKSMGSTGISDFGRNVCNFHFQRSIFSKMSENVEKFIFSKLAKIFCFCIFSLKIRCLLLERLDSGNKNMDNFRQKIFIGIFVLPPAGTAHKWCHPKKSIWPLGSVIQKQIASFLRKSQPPSKINIFQRYFLLP